jgi:4-hydroxythreonine-4-phosphate dehydrogenase
MSTNNRQVRAGISIGDPNGIGLEIILKTLSDDRILEMITPVIFASARLIKMYKEQLQLNEVNVFVAKSLELIKDSKINLIPTWEEEAPVQAGKSDPAVSIYALKSLDAACNALEVKAIDYLVTGPIDKSLIAKEREGFTGHTGYLGEKFEGDPLMILCSDELRVALVTGHIPLAQVSSQLSIDSIMAKLAQLNRSLEQDFGIGKPRIAVLGLNPHNGDHGLIGKEEIEIVGPAVERAFGQEILAFGPYSPDGFFGAHEYKNFDAVLALYHDQGLIPFKMLGFEKGVNFTAGLSIVRTSPDHGTAFDIADKYIADPDSFREALFMGREIVLQRQLEAEISENPLPFGKRSGRDS